jgi:predicted Zn-dependent protease with MMP-like domain
MRVLATLRRLGRRPPSDDDPGDRFTPLPPGDGFATLVADSLDELPDELILVLVNVPVIVSDGGAEAGAYGLYEGAGIAHPNVEARIVIFRDTLMRDFGDDPDLLAQEIRRTIRHELGHHLGHGERGVAALGL